tara:strand:- start:159 stop:743 length:585 start_codon:yes stop_codon:yes gene_type:complete
MNISKGHIYIIFCHINPKIYYIGSTFNELKQRWTTHKSGYKKKRKISIYKYFDKFGIDNFSLKLIKTYDVYRENNKDRKHLEAYEQLWINKLRDCCNEINPFNILWKKDKKIYRENNKEQIAEYKKEYHKKNKEKIAKENKEYYKNNKEQISEQKKEYNKKNKEKIAQRVKEYYEKNKEKIKEYKKKYIEKQTE